MIDRTDPAAWAPAMVSVGIVGLILLALAGMAFSVARKLTGIDETLVEASQERSRKSKRRPSKAQQMEALSRIEEHRESITRYHRAGGLLVVAAYAAVAVDIVISFAFLADPAIFAGVAVVALLVGGGLYYWLTKPPTFPPVPKDIA